MKLQDWLREHDITEAEFRALLGIRNRMTLWRWLAGEQVPSTYYAEKILAVTNGAVQPTDFIATVTKPRQQRRPNQPRQKPELSDHVTVAQRTWADLMRNKK